MVLNMVAQGFFKMSVTTYRST